jgi:hypothetical protein
MPSIKLPARTSRLSPPADAKTTQLANLGLRLRYAFEPGEQRGAALDNPLFELLTAVAEAGSIRHAAQALRLGLAQEMGRDSG